MRVTTELPCIFYIIKTLSLQGAILNSGSNDVQFEDLLQHIGHYFVWG